MQDGALTIQEIYRYGTSLYADNVIVTAEAEGARKTSYGELGERVARLAGALRELGVSGDQRVGTFQWNNQEHLEAYLAVPSMGAVLHTLNIRLFPEQLVFTANHAEDQVVIVDASLVPLLAKTLGDMRTVHTVMVAGDGDRSPLEGSGKLIVGYEEALASASPDFAWPEIDERDAAAMCYTSGTTGDPKGVVYSHRSCYLHSSAACSGNGLAISWADRVLPIVPMFHAQAWGLPYAAMMAGAELLMPDRFMQADKLIALIETEKPTVSGAVPTIWNDMLRVMRDEPGHDLSSLRMVACGGSAVPRSLMEAFEGEFGVHIVQAWGMTETSPLASVARTPAGMTGAPAWDYRSTQGRILCGVEGRLVDDAGEVQPNDGKAVGEVEVRGPWVTASYYQVEEPEKFDDGWLRTGDVGILDERGYITLTDRAKDVIKSGGEWISSVELETTLAAHPDIAEAAVVGVADEKWSERPLAAVVLAEGASTSPEELRDWLAERVAKFWLPDRWAFIDAVPRTSVGKFDKKVIRKQFTDGELEVRELAGR
jgi:fatty-acyl-CoA synthase